MAEITSFFGFVKILETWQTKEAGVSEFYIQLLNHDKISIDCIFVIPAPKLAIQMWNSGNSAIRTIKPYFLYITFYKNQWLLPHLTVSPIIISLALAFNLPFSPQFSNLSALIKSSFTPQRLITELTGVTNVGLVESNWSMRSHEWS